MYIGLGIALLVIGAVLSFAIGADAFEGINLEMIGYIFMAGGVLAILLSLVMRDRGPRGYTERRVTNRDPRTGDQYDEVHVDRDR
ncbi:hypothetical protein GCM10022199_04450 [Marihabitans asiaticum]|uniref:DUF6458 domain-containing protein n=1 Tax=Marihabitans asiaticum TaxID=415218 RepID=A0A560WDX5_9MICO|nr:DUF6458 family protein [Marihabitans asiaticum]TWD15883.1 hypothetical protein FB557_1420 [Marihabitans asiaticum]